MSKIVKIHAREILDSRGNPTVEADSLSGKRGDGFAQRCRAERQLVPKKRWNFATATKKIFRQRSFESR